MVRDPADTMLSAWRFVPGVAAVDLNDVKLELELGFFRVNGILKDMHTDYAEWWERRHDDNALLLFYDDLKEDLPREDGGGSPRRRGSTRRRRRKRFGADGSDAEHAAVVDVRPGALGALQQPARPMAQMRRGMWIEHLKNEVNVVQKNGGKSGQAVPPGVRATLDALWAAHVYPRTNCSSLDEMRSAVCGGAAGVNHFTYLRRESTRRPLRRRRRSPPASQARASPRRPRAAGRCRARRASRRGRGRHCCRGRGDARRGGRRGRRHRRAAPPLEVWRGEADAAVARVPPKTPIATSVGGRPP